MKYAKELDIVDDDDDDYAIGDNSNNEPLAGGNDDDDDKYASTVRWAESIILSATPAESMILSALTESIIHQEYDTCSPC
jgi:hypothetical protein